MISIQNDSAATQLPDDQQIDRWACAALQGEDGEISINFMDAEQAKELNRDYRGKDYATNVLSFPLHDPILAQSQIGVFGDLVICPEVVQREAHDQGKSLEQHLAHLLVHGVLHLRGYDHIEDNDADIMEKLECDILAGLGYPNPYQPHEVASS